MQCRAGKGATGQGRDRCGVFLEGDQCRRPFRRAPVRRRTSTALTKAGLAADPELAQHAKALRAAIDGAAGTGGAAIEVGDIFGKVNVLVTNLVATGRIKLGDIRADTGDATLTNLTAGADSPKKPERGSGGHYASRAEGQEPGRRA